MPDLVASLELIASEGPGALHTGELADLISRDVTDRGGLLTPADLAAYRPVVRPALVSRTARLGARHDPATLGRGRLPGCDAPPAARASRARTRSTPTMSSRSSAPCSGTGSTSWTMRPTSVEAAAGVPRARRPRPPRRPGVRLDGARLGDGPLRDGVRGDVLVRATARG